MIIWIIYIDLPIETSTFEKPCMFIHMRKHERTVKFDSVMH